MGGRVLCLPVSVLGALGVLTCFVCLRGRVLDVLECIRVRVFGVLPCLLEFSILARFMSFRAHMSYMLSVLNYLMSLRAWVLLWHCLSSFFYIWKVKFQNFLFLWIQQRLIFANVIRCSRLRLWIDYFIYLNLHLCSFIWCF